jgi:hypothetical protein
MEKDKFSGDEWEKVLYAPMWVFVSVAGADNLIDEKESKALASEMAKLSKHKLGLAREVATTIQKTLRKTIADFHTYAAARHMMSELQTVSDLLDQKLDAASAQLFKQTMLNVGKSIANASGDSFLGFGSNVSKAEQTALEMVAMGLKIPFK